MARPRKFRRVCCMPVAECFGPIDSDGSLNTGAAPLLTSDSQIVQMSIDEYESIRLMDLEGCTQEECANQMGIARTTVQGIYNDARKKLADSLVHGKLLTIAGGIIHFVKIFKQDAARAAKINAIRNFN
ncbi:DUF134 domain-containing protein [Aminipila terrae]|uniref:DUF134 domain-containing protein n=1 Tax=Aminipila terrae TaxID=2697030 RepID=UPI002ED2AA9E